MSRIADAATLHHLFRYEPETGKLYWRNSSATNVRAGDEAGCEVQGGITRYRIVNIRKRLHLAHRLIWVMINDHLADHEMIDHIDRDGLNNRQENLRKVDRRLNAMNSGLRTDNTSGVRGVTFDTSRGKWVAQIHVWGKNIYLGRFNDFPDAVGARQAAEALYPA